MENKKSITVDWSKTVNCNSEIKYVGEENPGEHYFSVLRRLDYDFFNPDDDECYVLVKDRQCVGFEFYSDEMEPIEQMAMIAMLAEMDIIDKPVAKKD